MKTLEVSTHQPKEIIDITDLVQAEVGGITGVCHLFVTHTTAALTTADLDPGMDLDMLDAFEALMPKLNYRHPHRPEHARDHILAALVGPSLAIPVENGRLGLGTWQRIILVELDGPRSRQVKMHLIKS